MYTEIARNKRRAVAYIVLFYLVWVGIGAVCGLLVVAATQPAPGTASTAPADIAVGMVIAGLLALAGIAYSLRFGARLVLLCPAPTRPIPAATPLSMTSSMRSQLARASPSPTST